MENIKYEAFATGPYGNALSRGLYDTADEALAAAERAMVYHKDQAYAVVKYVGPMDAQFTVASPLRYRAKDGTECRIPEGVAFCPAEIAEEDGYFTREIVAGLIHSGVIVAREQHEQGIGAEGEEALAPANGS